MKRSELNQTEGNADNTLKHGLLNREIFREYDIRGHAERDLSNKAVDLIARAFASLVIKKGGKTVTLGMDNRKSSERIKTVFANALAESGLRVIDLGIVPIPALYYSIISLGTDGGVMVTGSHLGKEFNGFKLSAEKNAATLSGEQIQHLRELAESGIFPKGNGSIEKRSILNDYLAGIIQRTSLKRSLKVVVDCGNGTSSLLAEKLFRALGCSVSPLYCSLDSSFPNHHPDPVKPENLRDLRQRVMEEHADFGIAFDGDADRLGVIDDRGSILWGDRLLSLFALDVLERLPGAKIVFEVKCSRAVEDTVRKAGGIPIMWKTGHSLIKKKMREESAVLAGEMSGHMFFADNYFGFDDALFAGARLCELVSKKGRLSELAAALPEYYSTPEIRVNCTEEEKWKIVERAKDYFSSRHDVVTIDGVRVNFENGWALIRASNTSPKLVLRMESSSKEGLERIKNIVRKAMESFSPKTKPGF